MKCPLLILSSSIFPLTLILFLSLTPNTVKNDAVVLLLSTLNSDIFSISVPLSFFQVLLPPLFPMGPAMSTEPSYYSILPSPLQTPSHFEPRVPASRPATPPLRVGGILRAIKSVTPAPSFLGNSVGFVGRAGHIDYFNVLN